MTNRGVESTMGLAAALSVLWLAVPIAQDTLPAARDVYTEAAEARKLAEAKTPIPRMSNGKPNLSGEWRPSGIAATYIWEEHLGGFGVANEGPSVIVDPPDGKLPYQPWALAERERRRRVENAIEDNSIKCILLGMPRMMVAYNFSIGETLDKVVIFHQAHTWGTRVIRFDTRPPLPDAIRLWMGDARGRWDGDTLVIESKNFKGKGWQNLGGDVITDAAQIVERLRMVNAGTMWWEATITDPKAFTRPWTMRPPAPHVKVGTQPEDDNFDLEDSCHLGNQDLKHFQRQYDAGRAANAQPR